MAKPGLFALLLLQCAKSSLAVSAPVIDLGYTKYQGVFDSANNLTSYLGIRYAAPPTGEWRWRAPQAPALDDAGVQQASSQPSPCYQAPTGDDSINPLKNQTINGTVGSGAPSISASATPSEDCLFLNVYHPGNSVPTESFPTLVWIHGGGYAEGSADAYAGSDLMREARNGIVVVIIQYRLGLFGFLSGSEVKVSGNLNAGLLDQDFALRWVNTHVNFCSICCTC